MGDRQNLYLFLTRPRGVDFETEDLLIKRKISRLSLNLEHADLERLQSLQIKTKLEDSDVLFLKENLPHQMFESFMLDRLNQPRSARQPSNLGGQLEEAEIDFLRLSNSEFSTEFRALKTDLQARMAAPVASADEDRLQHSGHWQDRNRQDLPSRNAAKLRSRRNLPEI